VSFLPVAGQPSRPRTAMNIGAGRPVADVPGPPVPGTWLLETTLYDEAGRQYLLETRVAVGPVA
jgi:hypothetical protein